MDGSTSVLDR